MAGSQKLFFFILLIGCSSLNFSELQSINSLYKQDDYQRALSRLKKFPFEKKKSSLLFCLESGLAHFRLGQYDEAIREFQNAKVITEKLDAQKFLNKNKVTLKNPLKRNFYGENFERSYAYYYLALSYFMAYQKSAGRDRNSLFSARAEVMAWDEFFKKQGKSMYFADMQRRYLSGLIHEEIDNSNEWQIAKSHYKKGLNELEKLTPMYANFNHKFQDYSNEYFKNLKNNSGKTNSQKEMTSNYTQLKTFFQNSLKKTKKNRTEVTFLFDFGVIPEKKSKVIDLSLNAFFRRDQGAGSKFAALITDIAFKSYLRNTLGIRSRGVYLSHSPGLTYSYYGANSLSSPGVGPFFQFAIPYVENTPSHKSFKLEVYDSTGLRQLVSKPFVLTSSLGEVSKSVNKDQTGKYLMSTGLRFLTKQVINLSASYYAQRSLRRENNGVGQLIGLLGFMGGSALVSFSEQADKRTWRSLPKEIFTSRLSLDPGHYEIRVRDLQTNNFILKNKIEVNSLKKNIFPLKFTRM